MSQCLRTQPVWGWEAVSDQVASCEQFSIVKPQKVLDTGPELFRVVFQWYYGKKHIWGCGTVPVNETCPMRKVHQMINFCFLFICSIRGRGGTWMVQLVERPALDFGSGHDCRVLKSSSASSSALRVESAWDSVSLPPLPSLHSCALSPKIEQNRREGKARGGNSEDF